MNNSVSFVYVIQFLGSVFVHVEVILYNFISNTITTFKTN